jgi:hypothetical protein
MSPPGIFTNYEHEGNRVRGKKLTGYMLLITMAPSAFLRQFSASNSLTFLMPKKFYLIKISYTITLSTAFTQISSASRSHMA